MSGESIGRLWSSSSEEESDNESAEERLLPPGTKNNMEQETGQFSLGGGGIKIPQLTDRDRYAVWRNQFCAVAMVKGFAPALVKGFKLKLPSSHDATLAENNDGKAQKKALVMNDLAVAMRRWR